MTLIVWAVTISLFGAGLALVIGRRQLLAMLLGIELMINAVNVSLVYYAGVFSDASALAAVLLILAVAAAEAVAGLSLILLVYRSGREVDSEFLRELKG
jgi:NADH-quinone oxidoreductase subunit K